MVLSAIYEYIDFLYDSYLLDQNQEIKDKLSQVKYSSRFSVGLFYPTSVIKLNVPWRIYYVDKNENEYLRFLAVDNAKRNKSLLSILKKFISNLFRF